MCKRRKYGGRYKFGWRRVDGKLVKHDEEQKVLARIFELVDKGYSLRKIAADDGVHKLNGERFCASTLNLIARNRKEYLGDGERN